MVQDSSSDLSGELQQTPAGCSFEGFYFSRSFAISGNRKLAQIQRRGVRGGEVGQPIWGSSYQILSSQLPLQLLQLRAQYPQQLRSRLAVLQASCAMNTNQTVPLGQINRAFSPPNYELLSEERDPRMPGQDPASTIINVHSYEPHPKDFLVWSVFNTLYMNFCCLGFFALVFSVKARDRKVVGDLDGARSYGSTAKCLNIFALIFSLLVIILLIVLLATGIIIIKQAAANMDSNSYLSDLFPGN